MKLKHCTSLVALACLGSIPPALAQAPPSFAKDIKPIMSKYCVECHQGAKPKGGLDVTSYKKLLEGGISFPGFVPGNPDKSFMLILMEKKSKPVMPPAKSKQPTAEEIKLVRAWIAGGGKDDGEKMSIVLPPIKPKIPAAPPVGALAYSPDGKLLVAGSHKEAVVVDVAKMEVIARLDGQIDAVSAVAFSRDGKRLAVASGASGSAGEVRIYSVADSQVSPKPEQTLKAHTDLIYALVFSPDLKLLATTGYDRLIKLWDVASGKEQRTLKDHSDTVYGLAFNADGTLLASAAADRAVKIWEASTGTRLYTLGDATDWLYALAWSPDGKHVAAAGVDKSIRVWEAAASGGKLVHSVFAHEGPVLKLVYAADGKTLYSLGEDRVIKVWDTARMDEKKTFAAQPEATLSLAVRADRKQIALGRYDGVLLLLEADTGKEQGQPLPAKPKPPQLNKLTPNSCRTGQTVRVTFEGKELDGNLELVAPVPGATAKFLAEGRTATSVQADVTFPATTPAGNYSLALKTAGGQTSAVAFIVDRFAPVPEQEPNESPSTGQKIDLPVSIAGTLGRAGDVDYFRFDAKAGQQVGVQIVVVGAAKLDPMLILTDAGGQVLSESSNGLLGYTFARAGTYALGIRDRDYRGGALGYRLHVGDIPIVTAVFPLGVQRGTEAEIQLEGVHLGAKSVKIKVPADAVVSSRVPLTITTQPLGNATVVVGEFSECGRDAVLNVPGTGNGRIAEAGAVEVWRFAAKKGQRLIVEIEARRVGSPLDSTIEILDAKGQPIQRAVLRCLAKTYTTFRDHDSSDPNIRLETWNELAINDYVHVGHELLRIQALPKNPDDNCQFFSEAGQRLGYLGTTPTYHSNGTPVYKVAVHPPGSTFAANGLPLIPIYYRNDDGGAGYGKDSRLFFDVPADGEYQVRVGDSRGQGGSAYAYRLTVRLPRPSFQIGAIPASLTLSRGNAIPVSVTATRSDGFDGPITLEPANLPPGFHAPKTTIPAGENSTAFALYADATQPAAPGMPTLKLTARATIDGKDVLRETNAAALKTIDPGDIVTTVEQSEVSVQPGKEVRLTVKIERRNGFAGRVPLEVRGLPHGVRVLDIGLNGILITERDTSRTIAIYCEPWVEPTTHPFVVLAKREGKGSEHAAKSVLLKVGEK
ncbi:MAG: hypothetical protein K2R98_11915 [Gemmataceae bacterium]|nr:hypothetical protein [Gemmataceae bacterium]